MNKFIVLAILSFASLSMFSQSLECQAEVQTYKYRSNAFRSSGYELLSEKESENLIQYYESERETAALIGNIAFKVSTNGHVESPVLINVATYKVLPIDKISQAQERLVLPVDGKISEEFILTRQTQYRKTSKEKYQYKVTVNCNVL